MKTAAFFDLDKTLITVNSGKIWMQAELKAGRLSVWNFAESLVYFLAYQFGAIDMGHAMKRAMKTIQGQDEEVVRKRTYSWFENEVQQYAAPGAQKSIEGHRKDGHILVLLTSSSMYESEAATKFFGLDDFLCTKYGVTNGRFNGNFIKPLCYGPGKVIHAKQWAKENDVDLGRSFFYTDSITDLPMLMEVGNPRVVNPDTRLKRMAKKKNWPILNWI